MVSSGIGGTMAPFEDIAGSAFALISAYKFLMCYVLGEIVMALYDQSAFPLGALLLGLNLFSALIIFVYRARLVTAIPNVRPTAVLTEMAKNMNNSV